MQPAALNLTGTPVLNKRPAFYSERFKLKGFMRSKLLWWGERSVLRAAFWGQYKDDFYGCGQGGIGLDFSDKLDDFVCNGF